jgi:hypothetical protein
MAAYCLRSQQRGSRSYQTLVQRLFRISSVSSSLSITTDDTIKRTQVHSSRLMLCNTFLREFVPIEGMAPLYQVMILHGGLQDRETLRDGWRSVHRASGVESQILGRISLCLCVSLPSLHRALQFSGQSFLPCRVAASEGGKSPAAVLRFCLYWHVHRPCRSRVCEISSNRQ